MRNIRWVVTAMLGAGLALFPGQAASGEAFFAQDPAGDVVSVAIDAGPNLEHIARLQPGRAHGDIVSMRSLHADRRVIVGLRLRNIKPTAWMTHGLVLRTDRSRYLLQLEHTGRRVRHVFFYNESAESVIRCADLRIRAGITTDRLGVSVPRGCLSHPRWVRVGAETTSSSASGDFSYDDALRRGHNDSDWSFTGPQPGPRLHRAGR